ncbi:acyltransferase family protein [Pseudomonas moraviensis]|uniref:acyltransferase family protein n=1 Tax=Pseudomonas moraviensis TaxID=321662 RepID=UPI00211CA28A|nr:acyltransferase family protein [Pseudomonas moraviensis]
MKQNPSVFPERLYALDALRGIAALAVVFWHWQHFFFQGAAPGPLQREDQPLYSLFSLFYRHGGDAVSLFFSLSGFIFSGCSPERWRNAKSAANSFSLNVSVGSIPCTWRLFLR